MDFFKFLMISFDAIAWPIFALGYPLVASVRAIETNSDADCRKLVTYWVLFSLISLFEHAFMGLLKWVLVWDYVKLMIVCWLMIPRFNGAFHVYNNFVHPCLSIDLQTIIDCFIKPKDLFVKKENFPTKAEKYVKANGYEALEKLFSTKSRSITPVQKEMEAPAKQVGMSKGIEPCVMQKDSEKAYASQDAMSSTSQVLEKKVVTAVKQILEAALNVAPANNKIPPPVEIKEAAIPRISTLPQVQKEWTSAMCQSEGTEPGIKQKDSENAYTSATSLALQVNGKKVVVTAVKQIPKAELNVDKNNTKILPPVELKAAANPRIPTFQQVQKAWIPKAELNVDKNNIKILPPVEFKAAANPGMSTLQQVQKEWTCAMCQVIFSSEREFKSHLQGSQHNATCEELMKDKNQASKGRFSTPSASYDFKTPRKGPEKCAYGSRSTRKKSNKSNGVWQAEIEKNTFVEVKNSKYLCSICNISCTTHGDLVSHLRGKKHLSQIQNCKFSHAYSTC